MSLKPISLYTHIGGPNGWKVSILCEELGIPYNNIFMEFGGDKENGVKHPNFLKINPNGRIPAIVDHNNNDFTLWESGAILQYLVAKYDKDHKVNPATLEDQALVNQWLAYQISGLGPSQGQANWFIHYHSEQVPSAIERYTNETKRIYAVLDKQLADKEYFVGGKLTIADIAYFPWVRSLGYAKIDLATIAPNVHKWFERMSARESVKKAYSAQTR